jgi:PAS domain S-box-containing protein
MEKKLKILNLEDNPNDSELIKEMLESDGFECEITRVETEEDFIAACDKGGFDTMLADFNLPSYDGLSALAVARERCPDIPFIFVSGKMGEEIAIESLKSGATDYVLKNNFKRLVPSVKRALEEFELRKERRYAAKILRESEERYRSLFENSMDAIMLTMPDGRIIDVNPEACRMLGYTRDELTKLKRDEVIDTADPRLIPALNERSETGMFRGERTFIRKDGTKIPCELSSVLYKDVDGIDRGSLIIHDVTERKLREERLNKAIKGIVQAIAITVETRDPYTSGHQVRVAELARHISMEMKLSESQVEGIAIAASIHDLGKISVPAEILSKPSKLSQIEFQIIQVHAEAGYSIVKNIDFPWPVADIIVQHHERLNGSGYPKGLKGDKMLLGSKILSVADVVEAIASHRPYRPAYGIDAALEEISNNSGILYDEEVVDACLRLFKEKGFKFE